ncbi:polysaccharide deacetylase family protein [Nocardioides piscis]|uniref:Polysaccharide deacetylase family protein n=1 Tax=Nocardioides piscis TaxID=2714938 RepID=A0A6G7YKP2_9ACTN|nr:polysaccharide deacetylase family protein [Nocardioides piscis]
MIGAHTTHHKRLTGLTPTVLQQEIVECRSKVEKLSQAPCQWFAWPFGRYSDIDEAALSLALETYDLVFSSDGYPKYTGHQGRVLNRRHIEPYWPARHAKFFLRGQRV